MPSDNKDPLSQSGLTLTLSLAGVVLPSLRGPRLKSAIVLVVRLRLGVQLLDQVVQPNEYQYRTLEHLRARDCGSQNIKE